MAKASPPTSIYFHPLFFVRLMFIGVRPGYYAGSDSTTRWLSRLTNRRAAVLPYCNVVCLTTMTLS